MVILVLVNRVGQLRLLGYTFSWIDPFFVNEQVAGIIYKVIVP